MSRSSRQSRSWFWSTAGLLLIGLTCAGITCQWYTSGSTLLDQGRQAYARGQWSLAGDLARRHLKDSPDDPEGLRLLARLTARLGRDRPANALFARLGKDALQAEDYFLLGQGMNHAGRGEAAVGLWERALRADSGHADVLEQLAQAYTAQNRLVEAQISSSAWQDSLVGNCGESSVQVGSRRTQRSNRRLESAGTGSQSPGRRFTRPGHFELAITNC